MIKATGPLNIAITFMSRSFGQSRNIDILLMIILPMLAGFVMLLPEWPGLIDLPGHASRYYIERNLQESPLLQNYYGFNWQLVPNLGVDLLVVPLANLFGFDLGLRLSIAIIPAIWVAGFLALARVAHGRLSATSFIALPCAFGYPLVFGFVNYCLSAGLALVAAAIWLKLSRTGRSKHRLVFGLIASPVLLISHITGWGLFGLVAFGMVFAVERQNGLRKATLAAVLACAPLAWPLVMFLTGYSTPGETGQWFDFKTMIQFAVSTVREQFEVIDLASALVLYLAALLPRFARNRFVYEPSLLFPALLVWLAVIFLPLWMLGSAFANVRLIPAALALTILAVRPTAPLPVSALIASILFFGFRLCVTAIALLNFDAIAQMQLKALDQVRMGSRVLAFKIDSCRSDWAPPRSRNLNLLATMRREALTNGHFSEPGAQLLTVTYPAAKDLMRYGTNGVGFDACDDQLERKVSALLQSAPLRAFDYVWLIDAPAQTLSQKQPLKLIWNASGSALYEVVK